MIPSMHLHGHLIPITNGVSNVPRKRKVAACLLLINLLARRPLRRVCFELKKELVIQARSFLEEGNAS